MSKTPKELHAEAEAAVETLNKALGLEHHIFEVRIRPSLGHVSSHAQDIAKASTELGLYLYSTFNGTPFLASPGQSPNEIEEKFWKEREAYQKRRK